MPENLTLDLRVLLPEFIVLGTALAAIVTELLLPAGRRAAPIAWTCVGGLVVAVLMLVFGDFEGVAMRVTEDGAMLTGWVSNPFSVFCRAVVAGTGALLVLISIPYTARMDKGHGEFYALLLFALAGVMLVAGVSDLLTLFVCLELVTISAFVLAAFKRNDLRSAEAGLKYLVIGAVSTAILLLGIAFTYGATGSLSFSAIAAFAADPGAAAWLFYAGIGLILTGLLFKLGGVPFHVWIPDVYQGAPAPVTAFLSTASKAAGLILLMKVAIVIAPQMAEGSERLFNWGVVIGLVAVATLLFGTLAAIPQRNIKRLLAYSSIGHAGYLLVGIAAILSAQGEAEGTQRAVAALLYYLMAYVLTGVTAFAVVILVSGALGTHESRAYAGLSRRSPFLAFAMCLTLLSLAGVPPMSGFFGKFLILAAAVKQDLYYLAITGAVGVVISLYFYLLWIKEMYFKPAEHADGTVDGSPAGIRIPASALSAIVIGLFGMLAMGVVMGPFYEWAAAAAAGLGIVP